MTGTNPALYGYYLPTLDEQLAMLEDDWAGVLEFTATGPLGQTVTATWEPGYDGPREVRMPMTNSPGELFDSLRRLRDAGAFR